MPDWNCYVIETDLIEKIDFSTIITARFWTDPDGEIDREGLDYEYFTSLSNFKIKEKNNINVFDHGVFFSFSRKKEIVKNEKLKIRLLSKLRKRAIKEIRKLKRKIALESN